MKIPLSMVALACLTVGAHAQGRIETSPAPSADDKAALMRHYQEVVAKTPGAEGVFVVREDGVKHVQSGLICPPFPNVALSQIKVFPSAQKGESVSCDYTRTGKAGLLDSSLSIMVTKADPGATVLSVFPKYQQELTESFQSVSPVEGAGSFIAPTDHNGGLHAEKFLGMREGRETTAELRVTIGLGWIVQVRAIYAGKPGTPGMVVVGPGEDPKDALPRGMDRQMCDAAMWIATHTVGQ
jgi:hypothetical protein